MQIVCQYLELEGVSTHSFRKFFANTIYVEKGLQTLNGEKALAFARNRHTWPQFCPKKYPRIYTRNR